jgi:hypothetical protein
MSLQAHPAHNHLSQTDKAKDSVDRNTDNSFRFAMLDIIQVVDDRNILSTSSRFHSTDISIRMRTVVVVLSQATISNLSSISSRDSYTTLMRLVDHHRICRVGIVPLQPSTWTSSPTLRSRK